MARTRQHDRMHAGRVTLAMKIYNSRQWKVSRKQAMHVAGYVCQAPGCTEVLIGPGACHVHHRKRLQAAWSLAYEPQNHQALCVPHHTIETNREIAEAQGKPKRGCDENGWPTDASHPWFNNLK